MQNISKKQYKNDIIEFNITGIDEDRQKLLLQYARLIEDWNSKVNLTGIKTAEDIFLKLIADTASGWLAVRNVYNIKNGRILDLGAGGGIAGIVIKIIEKDIRMTLLESSAKKSFVLQSMIKSLNLSDTDVVNSRAEEALSQKELYDCVVAKAVSELAVLIKLSFPFLKNNGVLFAYKSINSESELDEAGRILTAEHGLIENKCEYQSAGKKKMVVCVKKCFT